MFPLLGSSPGETFPFYAIFAFLRFNFSVFFFFFFRSPPLPHTLDHTPTPPSNCISFLLSPPLLLSSPCLPSFAESSQCSQPYRLAFWFSRDELFLNEHLHDQTGCRARSICFFLFCSFVCIREPETIGWVNQGTNRHASAKAAAVENRETGSHRVLYRDREIFHTQPF